MARKKDSPKAKSWDKLSQQTAEESNANRDVYDSQQLDRSKIQGKQSKTSRVVASVIVSLLAFCGIWMLWSTAHMGASVVGGLTENLGQSDPDYYAPVFDHAIACYQAVDIQGEHIEGAECYRDEDEAASDPPQWYLDYMDAQAAEAEQAEAEAAASPGMGFSDFIMHVSMMKMGASGLGGLLVFAVMMPVLMRNLDAQNLMHDTSDINQYQGDQHIAIPEEIQRNFSWFPDAGAHSSVQPSSMISHVMITNKGLKKINMSERAKKDMLDDDGDIEYFKGEILRDASGKAKTTPMPIIDEAFGDALFDASDLPKDKKIRKKYDTTAISYNPGGKNREKTGEYKTVAELINEDWIFPEFEPQRPGGAYIVDEAPVNTMVLAITRAGKGQTYIEPMIDMWLRERNPNNMVINDPKGELLVKNYVRATMRGYQVTQFNLINAMKTDIYNPLGMAAEAAREGDATKCALYVENIADVFFPLDGGDDPVWPNAANNAFKRAAYGLIDFYLEEERELRNYALRTNMDPKVLENELDQRWGKVTLYNCYQLFVQLSAKKMKNPKKQLDERMKNNEFGGEDDFDQDAYEAALEEAEAKAFMWEDKPELDMLTLYFNATSGMPENSMRTLVGNADNALRSMGAAEKMLASVYGIAITAMSFFTDPTISTLTSGTPSQNTDLGGLSFPRRMGVRFGINYLTREQLIGTQAVWDAWEDPMFTTPLEGEFDHEDIVSREGWARYYFKGMFPKETAYLRLRLRNPQTGLRLRTFYFKFTKDYQTSLDGRKYIKDPITKKKVIKNGILVEMRPVNEAGKVVSPDAKDIAKFVPGHTTYKQMRLTNLSFAQPEKEMSRSNAIISNMVRYSEAPKAVFLVTPPHLMKYAKLILILVKQLVDLNFDKSYMTKSNQKPLYKTRFMLDELGNLQSEGSGISGFETMLSIGLGQEQQFTLILQTLQQLRDVYGESVDKIVQGNTSNIVFLKSTDDSMIETLEKMSGKTHVAYMDSKTVTKDMERVLRVGNVEGKVSYTMNTKEEPVIKYNDMAFLSPRNSIVFRAGDPPVWNRNETILPMSWRLFKDTIEHPGHDYSLQTIPTLSSAIDFDVRKNQPDFNRMLAKRMEQAVHAETCKTIYQEAYDYRDIDIERLDPDVYSDEVMELVDVAMREEYAEDSDLYDSADEVPIEALDYGVDFFDNAEVNVEQKEATAKEANRLKDLQVKRYAGGEISREDLIDPVRGVTHQIDDELVETFKASRASMAKDNRHFSVDGSGNLRSGDGSTVYISRLSESESIQQIREAAESEESRVFAENSETISQLGSFRVHPEFYTFLYDLESWLDLANGDFEREFVKQLKMRENTAL